MQRMKHIAKVLEKYRLDKDWTYRELAEASRVALSTLNNITLERHQPSRRTMHKLIMNLPGLLDGEQSSGSDQVAR